MRNPLRPLRCSLRSEKSSAVPSFLSRTDLTLPSTRSRCLASRGER